MLYKKCTFSAEGLDLDGSGGSGGSGSGRVPGGPGRFRGGSEEVPGPLCGRTEPLPRAAEEVPGSSRIPPCPEVCTIPRFFNLYERARSRRADRFRPIESSVAQI